MYCCGLRSQPSDHRHWRRIVAVAAITLAIPIVPFLVVGELPGQKWLQGTGLPALGLGITGAALLALDVLLPIPSSILGTLLGARLGLWAGFAWTLTGLFAGHLIGFSLGRLWPARFAPDIAAAPTGIAVFLSRPVPVFAEAIAIAAGAARLPWRTYVLWCLAGDAIYAAALVTVGAQLVPEKHLLLALAIPMLLPVLAWRAWKFGQRRTGKRRAADYEAL